MQLSQFLALQNVHSWIADHRFVLFIGEDSYPLLFFSRLVDRLRFKLSDYAFDTIDAKECDLTDVQIRLESTFLGTQSVFWIKNIDLLEEKKRKRWINYWSSYTGPNKIIFYTQHAEIQNIIHNSTVVLVPKCGDLSLVQACMLWCDVKPSGAGMAMLQRISKQQPQIALDEIPTLMQYAPLVSAGSEFDIDLLMQTILGTDQSLFTLSSYFFAQQKKQFFLLWHEIADLYPPVFWLTFWSEQVWRACYYVRYARAKSMIEAKKIGYRLPFSFLQKDWKLHDESALMKAHLFLYHADYALKNGTESPLVELFFVRYFEKKF